MLKIAVSIGDLNGIGIEIALRAHHKIVKICQPIYLIDKIMLKQAANLLDLKIPEDFHCYDLQVKSFNINPGSIERESGLYSFQSLQKAVELTIGKQTDALVTLPIHKSAWRLASLNFKGHTDYLSQYFSRKAIMMMGCNSLFVLLFTDHIPLKSIFATIKKDMFLNFLKLAYRFLKSQAKQVAVLALNPHAGENGLLGQEDFIIQDSIRCFNNQYNNDCLDDFFIGPLIPDVAFNPYMRKQFQYFIALYHDQGLIPIKALNFEENINVSLNLPIKRVSVGHGTAFDKAYTSQDLSLNSYYNAFDYLCKDSFKF